ncbi:MAG TPA: LPS export ABC transporter permease LptF [Allosphingosinicella sp.]|nr:LPS export ABC transporter permease LptF [Allosphingosinicella sp.]
MILTRTDRYLARLIVVPLVSTLTLAAMLLMLDKMLKLFNIVISTGGPVGIVWKMLVDLLPEYFSLGIPLGLLLGVLLAFRRLALTSELDTLRGVGLSYTRLLRVPFLYALLLLGANVAIVGFLEPYALYGYQQLRFELASGALGASIRVGEFTSLGRHMTIRVDSSENEGHLLHGVFVSDVEPNKTIAVTADHGTFLATDDPNVILLRLSKGRLVHSTPDYPQPRILTFATQDLPVNVPAVAQFRARNDNSEMTLPELLKLGVSSGAKPDLKLAARAEFHYRLVEIVMMLLMPLLAVALAVPPKRSTSGLGIFVAIVLVVTYHKINQYGERMGELGRLDPVIALWVPFILFAALIVWMYWTLAYKPGGQPIGALERAAARAKKGFLWLIRFGGRRDRDPVPAE